MLETIKNHKEALKSLGAVIVTLLVIYAWINGYFSFIFYLFGFYVVLYVVSRLFGTTSILQFILTIGIFLLYINMLVSCLGFLYMFLKIMFEGNFLWGLLLIMIGLPIIETLIYILNMAIGFILGGPLYWMIEDLEKREKDIEVIDQIK